jgi:adenylate kinase
MFGPPGAGKGTQSALLVEKRGMEHISTGHLFREAVTNQTVLGVRAKSFMDAGQLVPDDVTIGLVEEVLQRLKGKSFILDGFPRTVPQAEALDELLKKYGLKIDHALSFEVPRDNLIRRLAGRRVCKNCGSVYHVDSKPPPANGVCEICHGGPIELRKDDHPDVIAARLEAYDKSTAPVKSYYQKQKALVEIDGTGAEDVVFERVQLSLR